MFVKATGPDLDTIERVIETLNYIPPQIHIKARFVTVPKGTMGAFGQLPGPTNAPNGGFTGFLSSPNARVALRALESRNGFETLAEPEVTTVSGRQTQMRATQVLMVVTNLTFHDTFTNQDGVLVTNAIVPQTGKIEMGPILDVVPYVLSDGYTINLALTPSLTEFLGYDKSTNTTTAYNRAGEKIDVPKLLPRFTTQQMVTTVNLWDNQTVIIAGFPETTSVGGNLVPEKPKPDDKELLVIVTATIVDPAGNRVHTDSEMSAAQQGIPPQPEQTK